MQWTHPKKHPMKLSELKRLIAERYDEVTILEILDIHADELVEAFSDKIEERMDKLSGDFVDDEVAEEDEDNN